MKVLTAPILLARAAIAFRSRSLPTSIVTAITSRSYFSFIQRMAIEVSRPPEYASTTVAMRLHFLHDFHVARPHQLLDGGLESLGTFLPYVLCLCQALLCLLQSSIACATKVTTRLQASNQLFLAFDRERNTAI